MTNIYILRVYQTRQFKQHFSPYTTNAHYRNYKFVTCKRYSSYVEYRGY